MGVAERRRSSAAASTRDRSDASRADADGDETDPANPPWRRILYERQGYPDNHTDDSFLERLVLNGRVVPRRFTRVALDATAVSQQLAVVALKASATASLLSGRLSARDALACDAAALAAGALVAIRAAQTDGAAIAAAIGASARLGALILLGIGALTPLFQTMTAAVSDDTAFATAACALVVSALTHDYAFAHFAFDASDDAKDAKDDIIKARAGNSVSLGCSMFAASVLASRLESQSAVFADMTLSVLLFVLFPFSAGWSRRASRRRGARRSPPPRTPPPRSASRTPPPARTARRKSRRHRWRSTSRRCSSWRSRARCGWCA